MDLGTYKIKSMKTIIILLLTLFLFSCTTEKYVVSVEKNSKLEVYKTDRESFVDSIFNVEFENFLINDSIIKSSIFYEIRMKDSIQSKSVYYEKKKRN